MNMSARNAAGLKKSGRNFRISRWRPASTALANFTSSCLRAASILREQAGMQPTMRINQGVRRPKERAKSPTLCQHLPKNPNKRSEMEWPRSAYGGLRDILRMNLMKGGRQGDSCSWKANGVRRRRISRCYVKKS